MAGIVPACGGVVCLEYPHASPIASSPASNTLYTVFMMISPMGDGPLGAVYERRKTVCQQQQIIFLSRFCQAREL